MPTVAVDDKNMCAEQNAIYSRMYNKQRINLIHHYYISESYLNIGLIDEINDLAHLCV